MALESTPNQVTPNHAAQTAPSALNRRVPSLQASLLVFASAVIPVFVWALISFLDAVPAYALRLSLWEIIGSAGYTLAFALLESFVVFLPVWLLAVILPTRWLTAHFVALGSAMLFITSAWMMVGNYNKVDLSNWELSSLLIVLALYLLSLAVAIAVILRFPRVEQIIQNIVGRFATLAYVYVALACVGVVIVIIRNV
jgi:hypothetical protein